MKTVNVIVSVFFFTVNASVGVNATELKCEHLFGYVYNNPEKKMIPISTDTISFVDFEAKKYKDSVGSKIFWR